MTGRVVFATSFQRERRSNGIWIWVLHSNKVTGTCNESDRTCVGKKVKTGAMQFGFMPRKGTTDAIFTVWQMQEKWV